MAEQQQDAELAVEYTRPGIAALVGNHLYDVLLLPHLERWVELQAADPAANYDFASNRHLLQLYKMYPQALKPEVIAQVLLLALTQLPQPHFLALTYLIPHGVAQQAPVQTVCGLGQLLNDCRFSQFWAALAEAPAELSKGVKGFDDAIRKFVVTAAGRLYVAIAVADLAKHLNLTAEQTQAYARAHPELLVLSEDAAEVRFAEGLAAAAQPQAQQAKRDQRATVEQFSKILGLGLLRQEHAAARV